MCDWGKVWELRAFEAELKPAINPKILTPESPG
jgi:hypothetical protein